MKKIPIDIMMWQTSEDNRKDDFSSRDFEFYFQDQKVGICSVRLCRNACALCDEHRFFPMSWFDTIHKTKTLICVEANLRPFLDITNFDFSDFQGRGFGRLGLQKMYFLSQKLGAGGRLSLTAQKKETSLLSPELFYEHCGFEGNLGRSGLKFFNPSPKNIRLLFSKTGSTFFYAKEVLKQRNHSLIDSKTGKIMAIEQIERMLMERA